MSDKLDDVIRSHCLRVLAGHGGRVADAARALGIGRATLYRYVARWAADAKVGLPAEEAGAEKVGLRSYPGLEP